MTAAIDMALAIVLTAFAYFVFLAAIPWVHRAARTWPGRYLRYYRRVAYGEDRP